LYQIPAVSSHSESASYEGLGVTKEEFRALSLENKLLLLYEMKLLASKSDTGGDVSENGARLFSVDTADDEFDDSRGDAWQDDQTANSSDILVRKKSKASKKAKLDPTSSTASAEPRDVAELLDSGEEIHLKVEFLRNGCQILIMSRNQANNYFDVFDEILPKYVVLYDPDVENVRRIEAYQVCLSSMIIYDDSCSWIIFILICIW
jgi:hypothetical protein